MNITGEIRWYLGENYARLKYSESKEAFSIDTVLVPSPHREKGIGTMLVKHVLFMADAFNKKVHVAVRPLGQNDERQLIRLVKFYQRFNFEYEDRGLTVVYMVRFPHSAN